MVINMCHQFITYLPIIPTASFSRTLHGYNWKWPAFLPCSYRDVCAWYPRHAFVKEMLTWLKSMNSMNLHPCFKTRLCFVDKYTRVDLGGHLHACDMRFVHHKRKPRLCLNFQPMVDHGAVALSSRKFTWCHVCLETINHNSVQRIDTTYLGNIVRWLSKW